MPRWPFALLPLMTWAAPLGAQPGEEAVRFQYTAPPACPDAEAFIARVRERTQRGRLAEPGELARTFGVDVAADAEGFAGHIEFLDDGGAKVARQLHGEQCDAVVSSLALITALALDATLREAEVAADSPLAAERGPTSAEVSAPGRVPPEAQAPPVAVRAVTPVHARIGFGAALTTALRGPQGALVSPRLALIGQLEWASALTLRLSAHTDSVKPTVDEGRRAALRILAVETSVCPWRLRSSTVSFFPCAAIDLGSLRAEGTQGENLTKGGGKTIVWASVGAEAHLIVDAATLPIWLELSAGAGFPLAATYRFQFTNPTALVYEVPHFMGGGGVAFGVRFW